MFDLYSTFFTGVSFRQKYTPFPAIVGRCYSRPDFTAVIRTWNTIPVCK